MLRLKRVYEPPARSDGRRILVDRLWPRGLSKNAAVDDWLRDIAPSTELGARHSGAHQASCRRDAEEQTSTNGRRRDAAPLGGAP